MRRAALLIAAAMVAIAAVRRAVRPSATDYAGPDDEGDAIHPDPYLESLGSLCFVTCGCGGRQVASVCKSVSGCTRCIRGYEFL